jgi:Las1-like
MNNSLSNTGKGLKKMKRRRRKTHLLLRMTPWKDYYEWKSVAYGLRAVLDLGKAKRITTTSSSLSSSSAIAAAATTTRDELIFRIHNALKTCRIWKGRWTSSALPHAVESSYCLADLLLRLDNQRYEDDHKCTNFKDNNDDVNIANTIDDSNVLSLALSTAIVRSVNGLADRLQQHRRMAAPISQLCMSIGLPVWVVDVRHEISHNALPALSLLQMAGETILGFFLQHYWKLMDTSNDAKTKLPSQQHARELEIKRATALLQRYAIEKQQQNMSSSSSSRQLHSQVKLLQSDNDTVTSFQREQDDDFEKDIESNDEESEDWMTDNMYACLVQNPVTTKRRKIQIIKNNDEKKEPSPNSTDHNENRTSLNTNNNNDDDDDIDDICQSILDEFVETVPQDIAYHVVLHWLIWGKSACDDNDDSDTYCGAIFEFYPSNLSTSTPTDTNTLPIFIVPQYLCQHYPGFATTILTHLVEYRLCHPKEENSNILVKWVQDQIEFWYSNASYLPLTWLIQRLELDDPLRHLIEKIKLKKDTKDNDDQHQEQTLEEELPSILPSSPKEQKQEGTPWLQSKNSIQSPWQLVESWEPCSIGSLPGYAV